MIYEQMTGFVAAILIAVMGVGSVVGIATLVADVPGVTSIAAVGATLALTVIFVLGLAAAGTAGSDTVSNPYW
ncbi:hypothetical protein ACOZ4N_07325 [Halorientalis pallida]|uniref:hypothetical protein n=1 Tax=Halorientalis pallida TaxID=2479928 RepID=UPI003C6FE00B